MDFQQKVLHDARERTRYAQNGEVQDFEPVNFSGDIYLDSTSGLDLGAAFAGYSKQGEWTRIVFGSIDVIWNDIDELTTQARMNVAWERMIRPGHLLGLYLGGKIRNSDISMSGDEARVGFSLGVYTVYDFVFGIQADGFLTFGMDRHDLTISDDISEFESHYYSGFVALGSNISAVIEHSDRIEIAPELGFYAAHPTFDDLSFTGTVLGGRSDNLTIEGSLTAGGGIVRYGVMGCPWEERFALQRPDAQ